MIDINLESFFFRRQRIARGLKKLDSEIQGLIQSKPDYSNSEIYEYIPSKYLNKAENMITPFKWLFVFENDFRDFCRDVLTRTIDLKKEDELFEKLTISQEDTGKIKNRIKEEAKALSTSRVNSDVLDFFTLPELKNLIVNNTEIFKEDLPRGHRFIDTLINQINRHRITVAHFFELDELDIQELENRLLRYYRTFD